MDLPVAYGLVLGREWSIPLGEYMMNNGRCMMIQDKDGHMIRVPIESGSLIFFEKKEVDREIGYIVNGHGNYVMLNVVNKKNIGIVRLSHGKWKIFFDVTS